MNSVIQHPPYLFYIKIKLTLDQNKLIVCTLMSNTINSGYSIAWVIIIDIACQALNSVLDAPCAHTVWPFVFFIYQLMTLYFFTYYPFFIAISRFLRFSKRFFNSLLRMVPNYLGRKIIILPAGVLLLFSPSLGASNYVFVIPEIYFKF